MSISIHLSAFAAKGRAIFSASKSSEAEGLLACGIREIDDLLEGGFPKAGLTEIMVPASRRGEVRMLLGAVSHAASAVWVLPERGFEPFLPAFEAFGIDMSRELFVVPPTAEEAFDAAELALSSGEAEAVVAWLPALSPSRDRIRMRRLQLAAQTHGAALFAIRPAALACLAPEGNLRLLFCRRTLRPSASGPSGITSFSILQKRFSLTRQSLPSVHSLRMSPIVRP